MPNNTPKIIEGWNPHTIPCINDNCTDGTLSADCVMLKTYIESLLQQQAALSIEETIDAISDEEGWEETRDYWKKKLLNKPLNE